MRGKEFNSVKPYVYWIKNKTTGIKYFGVRFRNVQLNKTPIQDFGKVYFTSGKLQKDFKKNPNNFKIKLIATFDNIQEAQQYEMQQTKKLIKKKRYANIRSYPQTILSEEAKRKISEFHKGTIPHNKGKKTSKAIRRKQSQAHTGKKLSEEAKRKLSEFYKGKKMSEEAKRKISEFHKGKKTSKAIRRKIATSMKEAWKKRKDGGKYYSHKDETKKKMSTSMKEAWKKRKETGLTKKKLIENTKKKGWFNKGRKFSEETRKKISEGTWRAWKKRKKK